MIVNDCIRHRYGKHKKIMINVNERVYYEHN